MSISPSVVSEITALLQGNLDNKHEIVLSDRRKVSVYRGPNALEDAKEMHTKAIMPLSGIEEIVTGTYVFLT